jgi:steroid delta-isomerase-like uncharacterized protein
MSEELIAQAREQTEAYNAGDWDRLRAALTSDSVYRELGTGRTLNGPDEIVAANQGWKEALPDSRGTVTDAFACGDRVGLQVTWEGTHSGALPLPGGGAIEPTGRSISVPAIQIFRMSDGKIQECCHAFDMMTLLDQLGTVSADSFAGAG